MGADNGLEPALNASHTFDAFALRSALQAHGLLPASAPRIRNSDAQKARNWLAQAFDEIDYGMLLLDESAEVIHANRAARAELDHRYPLQLRGTRLMAKGDDDEAAWAAALAAASRRGLRRLLTLGPAGSRVSVAVVPLTAGGAPTKVTLTLLGRQESCPRLSLQCFARAHGLTPAETRVLEALVRGEEPREIALAFDVGLATVRTQIGCIRSKVGVPSIRELMSLVSRLPPMLSAL